MARKKSQKQRVRIAAQMHELLRLAAWRADHGDCYIDLIEITVDGEIAKQAARDLVVNGLLSLIEMPRAGVVITDKGRAILADWNKPNHGKPEDA